MALMPCWVCCTLTILRWVLLDVALKNARADQIGGIGHRMRQGLRIVEDEPMGLDTLSQPCHEVFTRRCSAAGGFASRR